MIEFIGLFDTARDYTLQFTVTHTHTHTQSHTSVHSHVFTSRCLLTASNGGHSPSSVFSNYPRTSGTSNNSSQRLNLNSSLTNSLTQSVTRQLTPLSLTDCPGYTTSRHGHHRKDCYFVAVYESLPSNARCLFVVLQSLPSNGSTCEYNLTSCPH
jgi:hypothetical protein